MSLHKRRTSQRSDPATDTGPFPDETWATLERLGVSGIRFGATVVDGTLGRLPLERVVANRHLTMQQMLKHQRLIRERGLLAGLRPRRHL